MGSSPAAPERPIPLWPLALFRILFGVMYLQMALSKAPWIMQDGYRYGWLHGWIEKEIQHPGLSFITEIALGVALVLGLLIPLVGFAGGLWQVNIALGSYSVPQLAFALCRAGRSFGFDAAIGRALADRFAAGQTLPRWTRYLV